MLKKYIALLCTHIGDILPVATSIASTGRRHFAEVSRVIEGDLTGLYFIQSLECFYANIITFNEDQQNEKNQKHLRIKTRFLPKK